MRSCINWLKSYEHLLKINDSDLLQRMAENAKIPSIIKRRAQIITPMDTSIHSQQNVQKLYGKWIDSFKDKIADNRTIPCIVCYTLQSKKLVRLFTLFFYSLNLVKIW